MIRTSLFNGRLAFRAALVFAAAATATGCDFFDDIRLALNYTSGLPPAQAGISTDLDGDGTTDGKFRVSADDAFGDLRAALFVPACDEVRFNQELAKIDADQKLTDAQKAQQKQAMIAAGCRFFTFAPLVKACAANAKRECFVNEFPKGSERWINPDVYAREVIDQLADFQNCYQEFAIPMMNNDFLTELELRAEADPNAAQVVKFRNLVEKVNVRKLSFDGYAADAIDPVAGTALKVAPAPVNFGIKQVAVIAARAGQVPIPSYFQLTAEERLKLREQRQIAAKAALEAVLKKAQEQGQAGATPTPLSFGRAVPPVDELCRPEPAPEGQAAKAETPPALELAESLRSALPEDIRCILDANPAELADPARGETIIAACNAKRTTEEIQLMAVFNQIVVVTNGDGVPQVNIESPLLRTPAEQKRLSDLLRCLDFNLFALVTFDMGLDLDADDTGSLFNGATQFPSGAFDAHLGTDILFVTCAQEAFVGDKNEPQCAESDTELSACPARPESAAATAP